MRCIVFNNIGVLIIALSLPALGDSFYELSWYQGLTLDFQIKSRPAEHPLFSPRAPVAGNRTLCTSLEGIVPLHARSPHRQSESAETKATTEINVNPYTSCPRINNRTILLFEVARACLPRACASAIVANWARRTPPAPDPPSTASTLTICSLTGNLTTVYSNVAAKGRLDQKWSKD